MTRRALLGMAQIAGLRIHGIKESDSPEFTHKLGVIVFDIKGSMPSRVAKEMALRSGIGVRYGCHCAHLIIKRILNISPFLEQFQRMIQILFPKFRFLGLVRVSLGIENSEEEVDALIQVLSEIAKKPGGSGDKRSTSANNKTALLPRAVVKQQMNDYTKTAATRVYSTVR